MRSATLIASVIAILMTASPGFADRWDLILLTTSGLNGQLLPAEEKNDQQSTGMVRTFGGFARIQSIFESYRAKHPGSTITVATGDDLMGESLTNPKGQTVFKAMNKMGFDISTLGNHEFNRGAKLLVRCLKHKEFPTVVSNLKISAGNPLNKYIRRTDLIERNFVKVGFMGMILPELQLISNPGSGISVSQDIIESARKTALKLKQDKKADLIILLSHLTLEDQRKILQQVPEIDVICGGQSYKDILPGQEIIARDGPTPGLMVQCGSQGRYVGVLKISMNDRAIRKHEWTIIPVTDNIGEAPLIKSFISSSTKKTDNTPVPLAVTPAALDTRAASIRTGDNLAGNLVSSIMRDKFKTDIGFQNGGGIRGDKIIPAGPITDKDINTMFPFGNKVTIMKVDSKTLKQILERSVHNLPAPSGAFLQISGLKFTLNLKGKAQELELKNGKPVKIKTAGTRISDIKILDKSGNYKGISDKRKYSLATNSYLARGGDGYIMLEKIPGKVETFVKVRDVIKSGLLKKEKLTTNFRPVIFNPNGTPYKN
ncbi:bifunctional UDP-sugar hydrolase/5'-nucleotidase [Desulfovibrio sp. JC010]|uniref:bifunctional metallophosphatase/5'-nucleotidase n=1 Tax=Desulfovibrio sp. JC010 TaxID=2593641 RepID=UPI0013D84A5C|nr:bifunctional UDP-sugar hydrolase/5'-nucleotidase [Desulfovibrio sp. JC010]NDV27325.1 bifunctional metallophosphatase/5'-nucleotidase [Desulfovibrio sp. JC010]